MRNYSEDDVRRLLKPRDLIARLREAFRRYDPEIVRMPPRLKLDLSPGTAMLMMPCYDSSAPAAGVKLVAVSLEGGVRATYRVLDPTTAEVIANIEADYLTDLRTAATSAVATDSLARADTATLGIFGTGRVARAHAQVLPLVRKFRRVLVCGLSNAQAEAFAREVATDTGVPAEAVSAERCAREADVICTCTTSHQPLFRGEWLKPGAHINAVGAFQPNTREVDDAAVQRARVVVDTYDGAFAEAGDLLIPIKHGVITRQHVLADLHEVVAGKKKVRTADDQITLFKSVGCALEDLTAAALLQSA
jgi:ornithine cyclodeaminase/alanine dehydrogenase-like protein (mu-crystallin family)